MSQHKDRHCTIINGRTHQEAKIVINMYAYNINAPNVRSTRDN